MTLDPPPGPRPRVHPLDGVVLAAGVLVTIFSFFDYYTYAPKGDLRTACHGTSAPKIAQRLCGGVSEGAWSGLFGWAAVLVAVLGTLAVAVAVFAPRVRLPAPARLLAATGFGLGVLGTLLAQFYIPNVTVDGALASGAHYGRSVSEGHGISYWLIFALMLVGFVASFLRYQQTGPGPATEPQRRWTPR